MNRRSLALIRDILILCGAIEVVLAPLAWLLGARELHLLAGTTAAAATLALLGLFLTWGDEGSRVRNAARSLLVLCALLGLIAGLLLWSAHSASPAG